MFKALVSFKSILISLIWKLVSSVKLLKASSKLDIFDGGLDGFKVLGILDGSPDGLYVKPLRVVITSVDSGQSLT